MSETGGDGGNSPHWGRLHWAPNSATPSDGTGTPDGAGAPPHRPPTQPLPPYAGASGPATGATRAQPGATSDAGTAATAASPEPTRTDGSGRPRWLVPAIAGAVVVVVAGIVTGILVTRGGDSDTPATAASTILLPSPTPTVDAVPRTATTSFAAALPTSFLQYALASSANDDEWLAAGAVEAYAEAYTDGGGAEALVRAGQWETPQEAAAFAAGLVGALPAAPVADGASASATAGTQDVDLPQTGEVLVGGAPVGTFTIVDAGDGTGVAVWTNGTSVFRAVAPVADVADVYAAYPL